MITFVIDGALDQPTGGYVYDRQVIEGLRARGHDVDLVHLTPGGPARTLLENARAAALLARPKGVTIVDELCHPRVALLAALRPRRLVALVHHLAASERTGVRATARLGVERLLLSAAERAVVTSATTRVVLVEAGVPSSRIHVVRPGRDRLGERSSPPAPAPDGRARFLFVGALTPRKGVLDLVDAFAGVAGAARLTLAGPDDRDPAYAAAVRAAAAAAGAGIRVTGALSDEALAAELDAHDVLVLPSHYEGFGIVVGEALSHGLAVIASRAGALPEVVRDGAEALLVPPGDRRALMGALAKLSRDPVLRVEMQARALERSKHLPRWEETKEAFARAVGVV